MEDAKETAIVFAPRAKCVVQYFILHHRQLQETYWLCIYISGAEQNADVACKCPETILLRWKPWSKPSWPLSVSGVSHVQVFYCQRIWWPAWALFLEKKPLRTSADKAQVKNKQHISYTPETNMALENYHLQEETHLQIGAVSITIFDYLCLVTSHFRSWFEKAIACYRRST